MKDNEFSTEIEKKEDVKEDLTEDAAYEEMTEQEVAGEETELKPVESEADGRIMNKKNKKNGVKDWLKDIAIAIIIAFIVLQFIKPTVVREKSMEPTLHANDYLFLSKQAYRFSEPERGDIIVFRSDLELENGKKKFLIKRVIGLPGETITIQGGEVFINGKKLNEKYLNGIQTEGTVTNLKIGTDSIFVMGDNRGNSLDSRDPSVGCINMDRILGKAFVRLYPFSEIRTF